MQLQRGIEASDTGEIAGVGEQDGIPGTIDGVILHEPIWYPLIEAVCKDRIERPAMLCVAQKAEDRFAITVIGQIVETPSSVSRMPVAREPLIFVPCGPISLISLEV